MDKDKKSKSFLAGKSGKGKEKQLTRIDKGKAKDTKLEGPMPVEEKLAEHELDYRTHFERRMRLHNLPVFRSEFRKAGGGTA